MRHLFFICLVVLSVHSYSQTDSTKWLRAFPITDYIVELDDSTKVVQLELPEGFTIADKQVGVLYGVYKISADDVVEKGYGRCNLVKGQYYYFSIGHNKSGRAPAKGDLLYTQIKKTDIFYGLLPKLANHFIRLQNVYEKPFYDRYTILHKWTVDDEQQVLDSMVADIHFTGTFFLESNPSMNVPITKGSYKGKKVLELMSSCESKEVKLFLEYIIARPRIYAGREWKVSEIFATWLSEGAPMVIK